MTTSTEPTLRDLLAGMIEWRLRHIPPQRRVTYAATAVVDLFGLRNDQADDELPWYRQSATDLLTQAFSGSRSPVDMPERYVNKLLLILRDLDERFGDPHYQGFGAWCDRLVDEAAQPNRELVLENIDMLLRKVGCEQLRKTHPVVE